MELKTYISLLRKDKGLSQRELARKAQISHTEVSRIEKGERDKPSPAVLKKIAPFLGVRTEQLMEAAGYIGVKHQENTLEASYGQQDEYSYQYENRIDALPILSKNSGGKSTSLDLKSLYELDFALWVADNRLASVGLYRGDLALCSRTTSIAGARVLVIESTVRDQRELNLITNKSADTLQVCESGSDFSEIDESQIIGKVVAALRGMEWEPENNNENMKEWMEAINTAKRLGFTPDQLIWIIKKQAQFVRIITKKT